MRGIVVPYATFAAAWILFSDLLLAQVFSNPGTLAFAGTIKGWLFVAVTTVLLAVLVRRHAVAAVEREGAVARAQRERMRTLQLLEAVADSSPDAIIAKDENGRYILFNRGAALMTGKRAEEVLGRRDEEIFLPEVSRQFVEGDRRVMRQGIVETFEETLPDKEGKLTLLVTKGPLKSPGGDLRGVFGIARNITARKSLEERLRESELRFSTVFRRSPIGIAVSVFDPGPFIEANDAFLKMFGYTRDEVIGKTSIELKMWPKLDQRARMAMELLDRGHVENFEFQYRRKCGETGTGLLWGELIELGRERYFLGMVSDMTGWAVPTENSPNR